MINRGATLVSRLAMLFAVLFALAACGGGGGGSTFFDEDGSSSSGSSGSSSGGTTPTLALALFDPLGVATDTVTSSSPGTLTVSIPGGAANVLVSAETDIGTLLPESGTALTNLRGVATFEIVAGSVTGVGRVTATVTTTDGEFTGSLTINVTAASLSLALFDPEGNQTNTVTSSAPGTLRATVDGAGQDVLVSASTTIGTLLSGTALTNSSGVATFQIAAGTEKGAGTVTSTATTSAGLVTGSLNFQVGDSGLRLGSFDTGGTFVENQILIEPASTLSAGGNAQLSVVVLNAAGDRVTTAEDVRFTSGCIAAGLATINPTIAQSVNGQASTLYTAVGCSGADDITASLVGASAQAFGTINIAGPSANSIQFTSAEPTLIVLRGNGGQNRDETSDLVFTVLDRSGRPLPGATVNFSLSTYAGGLALSKTSAISDGDGRVSVTVQSGNVVTSVVVNVSTDDGDGNPVTSASSVIRVSTGIADQNSISLSSEKIIVPTAYNIDGVTTTLKVQMADRFNNPVVEGTAAVFTTELGDIIGSCTTGDPDVPSEAGTCSVIWKSSEPRFPSLSGQTYIKTIYNTVCPDYSYIFPNSGPMPCPRDLGYTRGQRSTILVYAIGEEYFLDSNANGQMDDLEPFVNLSEAFIDHNEDQEYTPSLPECAGVALEDSTAQCRAGYEETFIDFDALVGVGDGIFNPADTAPVIYNGLSCPTAGDGVWCSRTLVNVWDDIVITLSDDSSWAIVMVRDAEVVNETAKNKEQTVYIADQFNNAPPAGSTISLTTDDNCEIVGQENFLVPVVFVQGAYSFTVKTIPSNNTGEAGTVSVNFNPAEGAPVVATFDCDVSI